MTDRGSIWSAVIVVGTSAGLTFLAIMGVALWVLKHYGL